MSTLKQLQNAAKEMDEVMGLTPVPNVKSKDVDYLTGWIKEAVNEIAEEDEFTPATQEVIDEIKEEEIEETEEDDEYEEDEEDVPVKKAKEKAKPETKEKAKPETKEKAKPETKKKVPNFKGTATADKIKELDPLLKAGKSTKKELIDAILAKYPDSNLSGIVTLLTDGKNPKYNRFPKLLVENDKKQFSYKKD